MAGEFVSLGFGLSSLVLIGLLRYRKNNRSRKTLRIGSRKSDLAMIQTRHVEGLIQLHHPDLNIEIQEGVEALGDQILNESLASLAAKTPGLFTKELEAGLLDGQYNCVVHSLKDMPTTLPEGLVLAAITEREDPRDCLVVQEKHKGKSLAGLPAGSVIGTSSVRREAMLKRSHPKLVIKLIRGNLNTRLAKLDRGEYDGIILAVAGLKRLGPSFEARIGQILEPPSFFYGVGQGALGIQCRACDVDIVNLVRKACQDDDTSFRCRSERALLRTLQGGCQVPLGVSTQISGDLLSVECQILSEDGSESIRESIKGHKSQAEKIGVALANKLIHGGAAKLLAQYQTGAVRSITYGSAEVPNVNARPSKTSK